MRKLDGTWPRFSHLLDVVFVEKTTRAGRVLTTSGRQLANTLVGTIRKKGLLLFSQLSLSREGPFPPSSLSPLPSPFPLQTKKIVFLSSFSINNFGTLNFFSVRFWAFFFLIVCPNENGSLKT